MGIKNLGSDLGRTLVVSFFSEDLSFFFTRRTSNGDMGFALFYFFFVLDFNFGV